MGQPEILQARAKEILRRQKKAGLGVVLHLADGLDQGIVQKEFENPELFEQANAAVREIPARVVADISDDSDPSIQWRYFPLLNVGDAVTAANLLAAPAYFGAMPTCPIGNAAYTLTGTVPALGTQYATCNSAAPGPHLLLAANIANW